MNECVDGWITEFMLDCPEICSSFAILYLSIVNNNIASNGNDERAK